MPNDSSPASPSERGLHKHYVFKDAGIEIFEEFKMTAHFSNCIVREIMPICPDNPDLLRCEIISVAETAGQKLAKGDLVLCRKEDLTLVSNKLNFGDERLKLIDPDSASGRSNIYCIFHYKILCKIDKITRIKNNPKIEQNMW
jgi:hypothetical protein